MTLDVDAQIAPRLITSDVDGNLLELSIELSQFAPFGAVVGEITKDKKGLDGSTNFPYPIGSE